MSLDSGDFGLVAAVEVLSECPICRAPQKLRFAEGTYQYLKCRDCGLNNIQPIPSAEELAQHYAKHYEVDRTRYQAQVTKGGSKYLNAIERGRSPREKGASRRLLEVGCSWGYFLDLARSLGWKVSGVELSPASSAWAREKLQLDVFSGRLEDSDYIYSGAFDAVVSWHVIEHVRDPLDFLKMVRSCLKPGGRLGLRTPNIDSLIAKTNGRYWEWFGAPTHLWLFSPNSLKLMIESAGFRVDEVKTSRGDAHNPVFEILRGTAIRFGIHEKAKHILGLSNSRAIHSNQVAPNDLSQRRSSRLAFLDRLFDVATVPLWPIEWLVNVLRAGPDLMLIATRVD